MAGAYCQSTMSSGGGMDVWLPSQDWEALLARPLAEARAELRIEGAAALGRALGRRAAAGRRVAGILLRAVPKRDEGRDLRPPGGLRS